MWKLILNKVDSMVSYTKCRDNYVAGIIINTTNIFTHVEYLYEEIIS